jgi:methyl-accepting chemotaxis protein
MRIMLNIRQKFLGVSLTTSLLTIGLACGGLWSSNALIVRMENNTITASALRSHLEADMMHDALRADVLAALHAAQQRSPEQRQAVQQDLAEHIELFRSSLSATQALPLPAAVGQELGRVEQPLQRYIEAAEDIVRLSSGDHTAALAKLPAFMTSFKELEDAMSTVSDRIEATAEVSVAAGNDTAQLARTGMLVAIVAAVLLSVGSSLFANRSVIRPVQAMTAAMLRLAEGDNTIAIPGSGRHDELGAMARAVQIFRDNAVERERLQQLADAEKEAKERRAAVVERLIHRFDQSTSKALRMVAAAATELNSTAHSMAAIAQATNRQAAASASATEQASANVQIVAAAAEELAASTHEIARQVAESTLLVSSVTQEAEQTKERVHDLAQAARRIGDVVELISAVARQTDLLALNATIEAARAGENGRGFAVVASEVKALAGQTARATDEISAQINSIQVATGQAVDAITGIGGTIDRVNSVSGIISAAVTEQHAATSDIARNVQQTAAGCQSAATGIVQVTQAAGEAGTASSQVLSASTELSRQAETLKTDVERFLADIRVA